MEQSKLISVLFVALLVQQSTAQLFGFLPITELLSKSPAKLPAGPPVKLPGVPQTKLFTDVLAESAPFHFPNTPESVKCLVVGEALVCRGESNFSFDFTGVGLEVKLPSGPKYFGNCQKTGIVVRCVKQNNVENGKDGKKGGVKQNVGNQPGPLKKDQNTTSSTITQGLENSTTSASLATVESLTPLESFSTSDNETTSGNLTLTANTTALGDLTASAPVDLTASLN